MRRVRPSLAVAAAAVALAPWLAAAQEQAPAQTPGNTWAAEVRLGARVRTPTGNDLRTNATGEADVVAWDLEVAPRLGGALSGGGYSLAIDYAATLRARQPHLGFLPDHNHVATLQAGWRREGRARPFLFVVGNYGVVDLTSLALPQAAPTQSATQTAPTTDPNAPAGEPQPQQQQQTNTPAAPDTPPAQRVSLLAYGIDATFGVEVPLSPIASWTTAAGFNHGGGAQESIYTLPVQNSPRASTRIDVAATRRDNIGVSAEARYAWFSTSQQAGEAQALVSWRRQLSQPMTLELRAGAAGSTNREAVSLSDATPARTFSVLPAGAISWNLRLEPHDWWRLSIYASGGSSPYLDRFRGTAYQRVEWQAGFDASVHDWVSWRASGGASLSVAATQHVGNLFSAWVEGAFSVHPQKWWHTDLTGAWSVVTTSGATPVTQWVIGLSLTVVGQGSI